MRRRPAVRTAAAASLAGLAWLLLGSGCAGSGAGPARTTGAREGTEMSGQTHPQDAALGLKRHEMVRDQIEAQGITNPAVLQAMRAVPRHAFVPEALRRMAYEDRPLPIGEGQTISQPYIVALMTDLARVAPGDRVLEVGTGSGYQAAVLAEMKAEVYTIEIIPSLAARARRTLEGLGYANIHYSVGDGYVGWPEASPFDAILVTAAPDHIPQPLIDQLKIGGRLVIPVGGLSQNLLRLTRTEEGVQREEVTPVRFVPMTGEAEHHRPPRP